MKKIVDVVAVVKDKKSNEYKSARPIRNGKVERWWYEGGDTPHSINKRTANRNLSGREKLGKDLPTVEDTLKMFNFRGFEFGNWLSQSERYDVFRTFQYCLADMSDWLGSRNIGFDNQIGVAFGARGSRGAKAHYEAIENVINMTKMRGAGSLLHEYAHAIDYCVGAFFDQNGYHMGLSGGHTMSQSEKNVGGQFRAMMNKILRYARSTESYKRLEKATKNISYWGNSTEMFARITEAYYAYYHNKNNNHYLVKPVSVYEEESKEVGKYLSKAEMDVIKPELDKFWKEVGLLLNDKCKLKATPYPKETTVKKKAEQNAKSKEKGTKTTLMVYEIVKEQEKLLKKKRIKSNFKNKYKLAFRISQGKGSEYSVISAYDLDAFRFNAHERREFNIMLKEALKKAGIKATSTENGGTDGRPFYYKIDVDNLYRSPNYPDVRMSIIFRE